MPLHEIAGASELAIKVSHRALISHPDEITRLILEASSQHEPTRRANARPMTDSATCGIKVKEAPDVAWLSRVTVAALGLPQRAQPVMPLHLSCGV
jgi:hypothetical protein